MHALAFMPILMALNLSVSNLIVSFVVVVIAILLFVAIWQLIAPRLGIFANLVLVLFIIIVILIVCAIFGIFPT